MSDEGLPILPHISGEFYIWLWWTSEKQGAFFELEAPVGAVEVWIDERMAFRNPDDTKLAAVLTGDNPAASLEAKAALAGGKVLDQIRLGVRRDEREFMITLKGPAMHFQGLKLPQVISEGGEEVIYDRMHSYDEIAMVVGGLLRQFAAIRSSSQWGSEVLPALQSWILGRD